MVLSEIVERLEKAFREEKRLEGELRGLVPNADALIKIVDDESRDPERRAAFLQSTVDEIKHGADYSGCQSIKDMAEVFAESLVSRCMGGEGEGHCKGR